MAKIVIRTFQLNHVKYHLELETFNNVIKLGSAIDSKEFLLFNSDGSVDTLPDYTDFGKITNADRTGTINPLWMFVMPGLTITAKQSGVDLADEYWNMAVVIAKVYLTLMLNGPGDHLQFVVGFLCAQNVNYLFELKTVKELKNPGAPYTIPRDKPSKKNKLPAETTQTNLARRLEEYIEYAYEAKRFTDVGFYEELLAYIEPKNNLVIYSPSEQGYWSNDVGWGVVFDCATRFSKEDIVDLPKTREDDAYVLSISDKVGRTPIREKFVEEAFSRFIIHGEYSETGNVDVESDGGDMASNITRAQALKLVADRDKVIDRLVKVAQALDVVDSELFDKIWYGKQ